MAKKEYSLAHTKWMCKYHIVFTPKYRRKIIYNQYKYDLTKHPNYPLTADYDKKNWFDIEKYLNRKLVLHPNDEYEVFNDAQANGV